MVTDTTQTRTIAASDLPTGVFARAASQVRQFICGLHGHDALLHFEEGRMSLQCTSCGYETPGWDLNGVPARSEAPKTARHIVRLPLVSQRRVA
jgi:hypothetical protein